MENNSTENQEYVFSTLDQKTLRITADLSKDIRTILDVLEKRQSYWKLRSQHLLDVNLDGYDIDDWQSVYNTLEEGTRLIYNSQNAIITAVKNNNKGAVIILLDTQENPVYIASALSIATSRGYLEIIIIILQKYPNISVDLELAVRYGHLDVVKSYLNNAKISEENLIKSLLKAVETNRLDIVEEILATGIDPSINNVLEVAIGIGSLDIAKKLLEDDRVTLETLNLKYLIKHNLALRRNDIADFLKEPFYWNSVAGMIIGKFAGDQSKNLPPNVFNPKLYNNLSIDDKFYYGFLAHLIKDQGGDLINHIIWLDFELRDYSTQSIKKIIYEAVTNVLNKLNNSLDDDYNNSWNNRSKYLGNIENENLYYTFYAFLLLCWEPQYSLKEIISIISAEGANSVALGMAGSLIGAYLGATKLNIQGLNTSLPLIKQTRDYMDSLDIAQLAKRERIVRYVR